MRAILSEVSFIFAVVTVEVVGLLSFCLVYVLRLTKSVL